MKKIEIACFQAEDAKLALELGADRIEFCEDYKCGGVTPKLDEFILLRSQFPDAKIHVMIRPREGDFVYSDYKIEVMKAQMTAFESAGADGFVFGVLQADNTINLKACAELIDAIKQKDKIKTVFHRAFDQVPNPEESLRHLIDLGFTGLLTSGRKSNAVEGIETLKQWVQIVGERLEIVVGGGVRSHNISNLYETGATWYHSAAWDHINNCINEEELKTLLPIATHSEL